MFSIREANSALQEFSKKTPLEWISQTSETSHNNNTFKILLGLYLVFKDEDSFSEVILHLGDNVRPFLSSFEQAKGRYNLAVRKLLELALKACIVTNEVDCTREVLKFAFDYNYQFSIDEQIVWFVVRQTQRDMAPVGDFSMIRLLITGGVLYNIKITSQNKLEIAVDRKVNTPP